jgi:hypothetical protein
VWPLKPVGVRSLFLRVTRRDEVIADSHGGSEEQFLYPSGTLTPL